MTSSPGAAVLKTYRLLGGDGRFHDSGRPGLFGGNSRARIYGRLDCSSALRALAAGRTYRKYRVFFTDEQTAIEAGYRPCGHCMRKRYLNWRAAGDI